jgi:hypothetical protein
VTTAGTRKLVATLSLDLDNQWSYMKIHGDHGWEKYPSYLGTVVPRALTLFRELHLSITFFVVGKDAELEVNHEALRMIPAAGHEIGNHSYLHESWMHLYSDAQLETELDAAERYIGQATGVRPTGFRGPGYSLSEGVLRVLLRRGYRYDASTFPTFIGPLARAYYFMKSDLQAQDRKKRSHLFGSVRDGFRPLKPYSWDLGGSRLLEIPVTTFPGLRMPFHLSYIIYLASYSPTVAKAYWRAALRSCALSGIGPSILLHPLDCVGGDELRALPFFPGMAMATETKVAIVRGCLSDLAERFEILPLGKFAASIEGSSGLRLVKPVFFHPAQTDPGHP